ncbi:microfibrillar-associated protein 1-like [Saccoglossus kowalevskii]
MKKVSSVKYVFLQPDFAPESSDEDDDEQLQVPFIGLKRVVPEPEIQELNEEEEDKRLQRVKERHRETEDHEEEQIHRDISGPEVLSASEDEYQGESDDDRYRQRVGMDVEESSEEEEEELEEEEIERRRQLMRQRARNLLLEEEVMDVEEEEEEEKVGSEESSSEYEEYSDSEEETGPRLKPVFVSKKDRITIQEKEKEALKQRELELEAKKLAAERRKQSIKMVETEARKEMQKEQNAEDPTDVVNTDDENDEEEYESWKVRELKRIKRDREEREQLEKDRLEIDRVHNMTEEERRADLRNNPKLVTNKPQKGKYKFLQKYYHRGAFFLDKEDGVFTRDFSKPTLDDHFDKSILPKVMQVKNFGRSGRTKYTHLVDQDSTQFESPWSSDGALNLKFQNQHAAGMKQTFERPTVRKRKKLT